MNLDEYLRSIQERDAANPPLTGTELLRALEEMPPDTGFCVGIPYDGDAAIFVVARARAGEEAAYYIMLVPLENGVDVQRRLMGSVRSRRHLIAILMDPDYGGTWDALWVRDPTPATQEILNLMRETDQYPPFNDSPYVEIVPDESDYPQFPFADDPHEPV